MVYLLALAIGVVAGCRSMTAPAAVSWAAAMGRLHLENSWLAFFGSAWTPWVLTLLAIGELIADQLPGIPSRTTPGPFAFRILSGALTGTAIAIGFGAVPLAGGVAGVIGAVIGTLAGYRFRAQLAASFRRDRPAALIEDALVLGIALLVVLALP